MSALVQQFVETIDNRSRSKREKRVWRHVAETLRPVYHTWHAVSRAADDVIAQVTSSLRDMTRDGMDPGPHFDWVPEPLRVHIQTRSPHHYSYTFNCGHRTVTVYLHVLESKHDPCEVLRLVWMWMHTLERLGKRSNPEGKQNNPEGKRSNPDRSECSPELSIYLYLSDARKEWPVVAGAALKDEHVNTAFTVPCGRPRNAIYVFREEEWFKVLIHETMHALGLDYSDYDSKEPVSGAGGGDNHPQDHRDHAYEAYSECWAEWFAATVRLYEYGTPAERRMPMNPSALARYLALEASWAHRQCGRIWAWFNGDEDRLRQHDPYVFDYYVLKHVLMVHADAFVDWCAAHHLPGAPLFVFDPAHVPQFREWLKARYSETPRCLPPSRMGEALDNSLRMSLWGD